jgi:hypothetical protein
MELREDEEGGTGCEEGSEGAFREGKGERGRRGGKWVTKKELKKKEESEDKIK